MKASTFTKLLVPVLAIMCMASSCKHPHDVTIIPKGPSPAGGPDINQGQPIKPPGDDVTGTKTTDVGIPLTNRDFSKWNQNAEIFKAYTIHFDFDSSAIKSGENSKIASVADYLKGNPQAAVRVEGNCDERGTEEYNRSLGERRALAAREALIALGISPEQVDTISYGEDRPADSGHDDTAWAKNRRDDFVLLTPPPM